MCTSADAALSVTIHILCKTPSQPWTITVYMKGIIFSAGVGFYSLIIIVAKGDCSVNEREQVSSIQVH